MNDQYTPGSYTKNFSWKLSYKRLHRAVKVGFSSRLAPVARKTWRERSGIDDADRELIPLNFFLYSMRGLHDDFVVVDHLVERTFVPYDSDFARLALFAFHLATSGAWRNSKWSDGRVAGWANEFIRTVAWNRGEWSSGAFTEQSLKAFLENSIDGEAVTKRKIRTNYRFMLKSAGVLIDKRVQPIDFRAPWLTDATQLFWDRQVFSGELHPGSKGKEFEAAFFRHEIHKLLGCTAEQGRAIVLATQSDYCERMLPARMEQLKDLRALLAA
jgi:hypothetical protein